MQDVAGADRVRESRQHRVGALMDRARRALNWMQQQERQPDPLPTSRWDAWGFGTVIVAATLWTVVLSLYSVGLHNALRTHAEDLGIMDQVLWNTIHGHFMRQTICNPITDVNCLGGVTRFSIHFEPILIPMSLIYAVDANVRILLVLQAAGVALGAIPVYLFARLKLRHPAWGVLFAALYLMYLPLINATIDDFHPETMAAGLLCWALYFLFTRRDRALIIACVVLLMCKETLTLDVMAMGIFALVVQRRPRLGASLIVMGALTLGLALSLMRIYSPLGHSPVTGRFDTLKHAPIATLLAIARDRARYVYLVKLLAPVGFLPLLSPWVAFMAIPAIGVNVLANDPLMYSGLYQYNTDIGPILVMSSVSAVAWLLPVVARFAARVSAWEQGLGLPHGIERFLKPQWLLPVVMIPVLVVGLNGPAVRIYRDFTIRAAWPVVTPHIALGERLLKMIPPDASVSAQSTLVPHLSERVNISQFPSGAMTDQYVALDVTTGVFYPYTTPQDYVAEVRGLLASCQFGIVAAEDGYLVLRHLDSGEPAPAACPTPLPDSFYSFAYRAIPAGSTRVSATFADSLQLLSYKVSPPHVYRDQPELTVTTCWVAVTPVSRPLTVVITLTPSAGKRLVLSDLLSQEWLAPAQWSPGRTVCLKTWPIYLVPSQIGPLTLGVEVRAGSPGSQPPESASQPFTRVGPAQPDGYPRPSQVPGELSVAVVPYTS